MPARAPLPGMTGFPARRDEALRLLQAAGIRPASAAPPLVHLLWRLGAPLPPPLFLGFWQAVLLMGSFFGISWGAIMGLLVWRGAGLPWALLLGAPAAAGAMFGLFMALWLRWQRGRHQLPAWRELRAPAISV